MSALPAQHAERDATHGAAHCRYVLRLADTSLVLGQRLGEWVGHAPALEEDLGLANLALDLIGQARLLLTYAGELEGRGRDEDALAFLRDDIELHKALMQAANGYLVDNHDHRFADIRMMGKLLILVLLCMGCYCLSLQQHTTWAFFGYYFFFIFVGFYHVPSHRLDDHSALIREGGIEDIAVAHALP